MFEYHLFGLLNPNGYDPAPWVFSGTTHDFLQVIADIGKHYGIEVAGMFLVEMLKDHKDELDYLRITSGWNFEMTFSELDPRKIVLRKVA